MINIKLVFLGQYGNTINIKKIEKWKSKLFKISVAQILSINTNPMKGDGTLVQYFSDMEVLKIIGNDILPENTIKIAVTNYSLQDNFYVRLVGNKTAILTLKYVKEVLLANGYTIEMFIIKNLYELSTMYVELNGTNLQQAYEIPHIETRQCLFDMNGDKYDILYNTEKPSICIDCIRRLSTRTLQKDYVKILQKELKRLRRPVLRRVEDFIKRFPLISICLSFLVAIITNIIASFIFEMLSR